MSIRCLAGGISPFITPLLRAGPPDVSPLGTLWHVYQYMSVDVAEENIIPTTLRPYAYCRLFENAPEAGRYFEGLVQANDRARLLLSPELLCAYPEDNAVGERWIKEGTTG